MKECLAMPAANGTGICTELHSDLLPRIVVDVPVLEYHALVGIRNCLNDLSYCLLYTSDAADE